MSEYIQTSNINCRKDNRYSYANNEINMQRYYFEITITHNNLTNTILRKIKNGKIGRIIDIEDNIIHCDIKKIKMLIFDINNDKQVTTNVIMKHNLTSTHHNKDGIYLILSATPLGFSICTYKILF